MFDLMGALELDWAYVGTQLLACPISDIAKIEK